MTPHRLHDFLTKLQARRDRHAELGDQAGARALDGLIAKVVALITEADKVLSRLGDPPTDR